MISVPRKLRGRPTGMRRPSALILLGVALTVTACSGSTPPDPAPGVTEQGPVAGETSPAVPDTTASSDVDADAVTAEDPPEEIDPDSVATSVQAALDALVAREPAVTSDQVRTALEQGFTDAGSVPESVEVSVDRTPTGLDVDAIQGAGRLEDSCVFGEVRAGDVSVAVLPVLSSGLCFVGDQR